MPSQMVVCLLKALLDAYFKKSTFRCLVLFAVLNNTALFSAELIKTAEVVFVLLYYLYFQVLKIEKNKKEPHNPRIQNEAQRGNPKKMHFM